MVETNQQYILRIFSATELGTRIKDADFNPTSYLKGLSELKKFIAPILYIFPSSNIDYCVVYEFHSLCGSFSTLCRHIESAEDKEYFIRYYISQLLQVIQTVHNAGYVYGALQSNYLSVDISGNLSFMLLPFLEDSISLEDVNYEHCRISIIKSNIST